MQMFFRVKFMVVLVATVFAGYFFFSIASGLYHNRQVIKRYELLQQSYEEATALNARLQYELKQINSDHFVEQIARDRLGLVRPNEVAYKIVHEE